MIKVEETTGTLRMFFLPAFVYLRDSETKRTKRHISHTHISKYFYGKINNKQRYDGTKLYDETEI